MTEMLDVLQKGGPWGIVVLAILAVVYLFKDGRARERELTDARIEDLKSIQPLAAKQNEAISALERVVSMLMTKGAQS